MWDHRDRRKIRDKKIYGIAELLKKIKMGSQKYKKRIIGIAEKIPKKSRWIIGIAEKKLQKKSRWIIGIAEKSYRKKVDGSSGSQKKVTEKK